MDADGTLHQSTLGRVDAAVALFKAGKAPLIVMTGGRMIDGAPSAGEQMKAAAIRAGVPETAIRAETASLSTLQNALLSKPILQAEGVGSVILVTEGFHMARSLATMRWAEIEVTGINCSTAFRGDVKASVTMILREVLAWGFNLVRVALWHILGVVGWSFEDRLPYLS